MLPSHVLVVGLRGMPCFDDAAWLRCQIKQHSCSTPNIRQQSPCVRVRGTRAVSTILSQSMKAHAYLRVKISDTTAIVIHVVFVRGQPHAEGPCSVIRHYFTPSQENTRLTFPSHHTTRLPSRHVYDPSHALGCERSSRSDVGLHRGHSTHLHMQNSVS